MSKYLPEFKEMNRTHVFSHTKSVVYKGFFSVEEHKLSYRKFDQSQTDILTRSAVVLSDAVIVLPYDPVNDRILLIEQFRTGPYVKGDKSPCQPRPWPGCSA